MTFLTWSTEKNVWQRGGHTTYINMYGHCDCKTKSASLVGVLTTLILKELKHVKEYLGMLHGNRAFIEVG